MGSVGAAVTDIDWDNVVFAKFSIESACCRYNSGGGIDCEDIVGYSFRYVKGDVAT